MQQSRHTESVVFLWGTLLILVLRRQLWRMIREARDDPRDAGHAGHASDEALEELTCRPVEALEPFGDGQHGGHGAEDPTESHDEQVLLEEEPADSWGFGVEDPDGEIRGSLDELACQSDGEAAAEERGAVGVAGDRIRVARGEGGRDAEGYTDGSDKGDVLEKVGKRERLRVEVFFLLGLALHGRASAQGLGGWSSDARMHTCRYIWRVQARRGRGEPLWPPRRCDSRPSLATTASHVD